MDFEIKEIKYGSLEYHLEVHLRSKILRQPLGLSFSPSDLSKDENDLHLGAFSDGLLLGCLILSRYDEKTMKMRQVAIRTDLQGRGVGRSLVQASEIKCREQRILEITLNARVDAITFYIKLGYKVYGELFQEVTLPHQKMRKSL